VAEIFQVDFIVDELESTKEEKKKAVSEIREEQQEDVRARFVIKGSTGAIHMLPDNSDINRSCDEMH